MRLSSFTAILFCIVKVSSTALFQCSKYDSPRSSSDFSQHSIYAAQEFTIVKGRYQAELILLQYDNTPPGKCHDCNNVFTSDQQLLLHQGCCDNPTNNGTCNGDDLCDVYFTCCLRPFGSTVRGCSNYTYVTSSVESDTSSFSFPQQDVNVLGLPNPLLLPGLTNAYMVWSHNNSINIIAPTHLSCFMVSVRVSWSVCMLCTSKCIVLIL